MTIEAIDHVQLAMPAGREADARSFYGDLLGFSETAKPADLAVRGGCWFQSGQIKIHLGVETPFHPARKAHIAFRVDGFADLGERARAMGLEVVDDAALPGHDRIFIHDPFGNRLEFLTPITRSF